MSSLLVRMSQVLADVATAENSALQELCNEGIFFMPEIAYAYACGKELMARRSTLAPDLPMSWKREIKLHTDGPCDLVVDLSDGRQVAFEFKVRSTLQGYQSDLEKLMRIKEPKMARVFCALVDSFTRDLPDTDERIRGIERSYPGAVSRLLDPFPSFPTVQSVYKRDISCVVAVWSVGPIPEWAGSG